MKKNAIKLFRLKLLWEQDKLAKELGVTRGAVGNWEVGTRNPSLAVIRKLREIAEAHNIKINLDDFMNK